MPARSKARKRALDVLFAADARELPIDDMLQQRLDDTDAVPLGDFAEGLIRGVRTHLGQIDGIIAQHSIDWGLDRMPAVDRAILRLAVYELIYAEDAVDQPVVIDEAVELAKRLSTDSSPRFVNGVLAQVAAIAVNLRH